MSEYLLSVGIDLGTTTTQLVFSRLEVNNTASATSIPRIQIVGKEIIYRSDIHFTPLLDRRTIDAVTVRELVESEYRKAGITPADLAAGAIIITGEAARKENSEAVLRALSDLAGDFVAATAGSDLEAIMAGRGAGTALMSARSPGKLLVNLDIGGGTTNIAVFRDGEPIDTTCLDIGGRQIILEPHSLRISYMAGKIADLARNMGIALAEGRPASLDDLTRLCDRLADILACSLGLADGPVDGAAALYTTHPLRSSHIYNGLTFSGGVADYIYQEYNPASPFPHGDIGPLLGHAIRECRFFRQVEQLRPLETIRATVVGAGANTMEISGSTIAVSHSGILPVKNIPILKLTGSDEGEDFLHLASRLAEKIAWFKEEYSDSYQTAAVACRGIANPTFAEVKRLARKVADGLADYLRANDLVIIVLDHDMAKSLGNALMNALPDKKIICLDNITVENGDYIDIGLPLANGRVLPVVVKTLLFGR